MCNRIKVMMMMMMILDMDTDATDSIQITQSDLCDVYVVIYDQIEMFADIVSSTADKMRYNVLTSYLTRVLTASRLSGICLSVRRNDA